MEWIQRKSGKQTEKHIAHIKSPDFYKFYAYQYFKKLETPESKLPIIDKKSIYNISYSTYNKILTDFNAEIARRILYENFEFKMPYRLGTLSIKKVKTLPYIDAEGTFVNNLPVDWGETWKLWKQDKSAYEKKKLIRFENKHTKGYIGKWKYSKVLANYRNQGVYTFLPCRTNKTRLANILKDENSPIDYYEL